MVELKGTEKQVAWAKAIREWVKKICDEALENGHIVKGFNDDRKAAFAAAIDILMEKDQAKFWIESFGDTVKPRELEKLDGKELNDRFISAGQGIMEVMHEEVVPVMKERGIKGTSGIAILQKYFYKKDKEV